MRKKGNENCWNILKNNIFIFKIIIINIFLGLLPINGVGLLNNLLYLWGIFIYIFVQTYL